MLLDYVEYDIDIKLTKVMLNISVKDFLRILQLTPPSLSIKDIHSSFFKAQPLESDKKGPRILVNKW